MRVRIVFAVALISTIGSAAKAGDTDSRVVSQSPQEVSDLVPAEFEWGTDLSGPLCGVYAACTALELIGIKADPRDFIATRYVSNCGGSSPEEAARVVRDSGAAAHILTRLSAFDLRLIDCPIIANVRTTPASNRFNHWVVAVPSDEGVTIYDGLQKPYEIRTAEFLGSWSGLGICVTRSGSTPLASIWLGRSSVVLAVGIVGVLAWRSPAGVMFAGEMGTLRQFCALGVVSVALSIAGNLVFGDLLNHGKGVAAAANQGGKYRIGTLKDAAPATKSRSTLLVDARRQEDYQLGTIEGAINVPVTASTWAIQRYLEKVRRETPIVVFGQSEMRVR